MNHRVGLDEHGQRWCDARISDIRGIELIANIAFLSLAILVAVLAWIILP